MAEPVVLVTGSRDGIGRAIARELAIPGRGSAPPGGYLSRDHGDLVTMDPIILYPVV